jgi:hypothetical protein
MHARPAALAAALVLLHAAAAHAARTCLGTLAADPAGAPLVPIDALAAPYTDAAGHVFSPGLYGNGRNVLPPEHAAAGLAFAADAARPRHADGAVCAGDLAAPENADCTFVFLSITMSNGTQEWAGRGPDVIDPALGFVSKAMADPDRNPALTVVDAGLGGMQAMEIAGRAPDTASYDSYWGTYVPDQLAAAGVTDAQVTVVWLKLANHEETDPDHAAKLTGDTLVILQLLRARFPNLKMAYLNSRSYGGYIGGNGNYEPIAYEQGLVMAAVIAAQIAGDPAYCYEGQPGCAAPALPWLDWGAYIWANGTTPRADGLVWLCGDFRDDDGQHPSAAGVVKVADLLLAHFAADAVARTWFLSAEANAAIDDLADPAPDPSAPGAACACRIGARARTGAAAAAPAATVLVLVLCAVLSCTGRVHARRSQFVRFSK